MRAVAKRFLPRVLLAPAVVTLLLWMIVPLVMTMYFSTLRYNLMQPGDKDFIGLENFIYFATDPDFWPGGDEHDAAARLGDRDHRRARRRRSRCSSTNRFRAAASFACC